MLYIYHILPQKDGCMCRYFIFCVRKKFIFVNWASLCYTNWNACIPLRAKVHLVSTIKIVKRGGGLEGLIDSGPFARQSRRTESLEARQAGPNRACFFLFFCPQIGVTLNSPGRLFQPSPDLLFFNTTRSGGLNPSGILSGFYFNKPDLLCLMIHKILELYLRKKWLSCVVSFP